MKFILPICCLMLWNEVYTSYLLSNVINEVMKLSSYEMKSILPICCLWNEVYTSYLLSNVMKWSLYFLFVV